MQRLLADNSLMHHMSRGSFGHFNRAIEKLSVDWQEPLPNVVILGSESSGKSSLVENMTKCHVFPRNRNICTKMPVCLELKTDKEELVELEIRGNKILLPDRGQIYATIAAEFVKLGDSLQKEEVVIRITAKDAPTLTLVDLPGLRTYPQLLAEQSREMAEQYLSSPDTLVICVVQATDRLTANNAVALAMSKLGAEMKTRAILVLTKPDIVTEEEMDEKVISRLNGTSAELKGVDFAARVAVISRPQERDGSEKMDLPEVQEWEDNWWGRLNLPAALRGQIGVQSLIQKVDEVFSEHIRTSWKPRALPMLEAMKVEPLQQLEALGPDPSTLTPQQVHADVRSRLHRIGNTRPLTLEPLAAQPVTQTGSDWDYTMKMADLAKDVHEWSQRLVASPTLLRDIIAIIDAAFEDSSPLKTKRFAAMRDAVRQIAREEFERRKPLVAGRVAKLVQDWLDSLTFKESQTPADLETVKLSVTRVATALVYSTVCAMAATDATQLSLAECPEVRDERAELNDILNHIHEAICVIGNL